MLVYCMFFLTSFIFETTFSVIDYVDLNKTPILDILLNFELLPQKIPVYYRKMNGYLDRAYLGDSFEFKEDSDLVIDLIKLRYVSQVFAMGYDCNSTGMEVFVEHLDKSRKLSKCIRSRCHSLVRKILIRKMPKNCKLRILGYTSHSNWYLGCIKTEHDNYTLYSRNSSLTIYEECAFRCDENDYIGLFMAKRREACKCFHSLNGIVSVKQELCQNLCSDAPDYCGGEDSYISLYLSERSKKIPPTCKDYFRLGHLCEECDFGWRGYDCELSDCETNNGNCGSMECHNLTVWGERFKTCSCGDGYKLSNVWGECNDINECAEESICPEGQICKNTVGSFACGCQEGYQIGETGACTDVDECNTLSVTFCDVVSTICVNNVGSYSCKCRDGFRSDAMKINVCEDLDECLANPCDTTSTNCRNIPGSFDCSCFLGYHKIGYFRCEDDDECSSLFRKCPIGVPCVNLPGTYECYCPIGTKKNVQFYGTDCDDIDECLDDYICDQTSSFCVNGIMSYACICRFGFVQVDNFTCEAQDAIFTQASTQTVSSEIFTNEPAEESSTTSNAFYFGLGLLIALCMVSCFGCLCFAAKKAKSLISNQSSASAPSIEMEVHEE